MGNLDDRVGHDSYFGYSHKEEYEGDYKDRYGQERKIEARALITTTLGGC
jgi:hypothetical protein